MVSNYRVPPPFDEEKPYESWKNEVAVWTRVTDLEKKKQALAVALALSGRAREVAMEISVEDLNKDTGMETLLVKLDNLFLKEEKDRIYEAYSSFDRITRSSNVSMTDYIIDFEQRYARMRKYKMELPDAVLAFKLLDTACLDVKDRQLALTACAELTFAAMKSALKRIFGGKMSGSTVGINQDAAYITEQRRQLNKSWSHNDKQKTPWPGTNPLDRYGRRSKCAICQSTFHWAKDCPHKAGGGMSFSPVPGTEVPQTANGVATPVGFENGPHLSVKCGSSSVTGSAEASVEGSLGYSENLVDVESEGPDGEHLSDAETDINGRTCSLSINSPQTVDSSFTAGTTLHSEPGSRDTEGPESSETAEEVLMWKLSHCAESKHSNEHGGPETADRLQTPSGRAEGGADSQDKEDGEKEKQDEEEDEKDESTWSCQHPGRMKDTELSRHYSSSAPGPSTSSSSSPPALLPSDEAPYPPHVMAQVWVRNVRGMQDSKSLDELSQACGGGSGVRSGGRGGQSEGRRATISSALELEGTVSQEGDLTNFITKNLEQKIKMSSKPSLDCSDSDCSGPIYRSRGLSRRPADIPPIDATVLLDLQKHVQDVAHSVELMMRSLNGTIQNMTALSVGYIQTYRDSVDSLGESVDMSIKGMYTLMARCEELDRSMQPIHVLAAQIRDIKRTLDALEAICK